jgi:glycosyltransferase involved in cell wall biosynthesis
LFKDSEKFLSIIIPFYNSALTVGSLIKLINSNFFFNTEIIVIDDASTDGSKEVIERELQKIDNTIFLKNETNMGAGISRNRGLEAATGKYILFFDADDMLHADAIKNAIHLMDRDSNIDVAVFQYKYMADVSDVFSGMSYIDEQIFSAILDGKRKRIVTINSHPELTRISNYPWNKVIRSSRYKDNLLFGSTKVHNDIYANWQILTKARKILVSDDVICTHILNSHGSNLTNLQSKERLELFIALTDTYEMLEASPHIRKICAIYFWDLATSLASWSRSRIEDEFESDFNLAYDKLIGKINLEDILVLRKCGYSAVLNNMTDRTLCLG